MDNSNNQNQPNENNDYQGVLDQAAASVKPEPEPELEKEKNADPQAFIKEVNSPQLESPIHPSLSANLEEEPIVTPPVTPEIPTPSTPTPTPVSTPAPPIQQEETRTPEEIKEEVNKILADDIPSSNSDVVPPVKSGLNFFKIFFIFSLLAFLAIGGILIYSLFFAPSSQTASNKSTVNPTPTVSSGVFCDLNNKRYFQGESFPSADGCNTCTCESQDIIACTEKACLATKSATLTPTKSATSSSIPKDWKVYEDKEIGFSFSYPKNITLTKKISNGVFFLAINAQINLAGGVNMVTGITTDRGGGSLDFGGYTKNGNQITYFSNKNISTICDSKLIKKIYNNPNGLEIVLLEGTLDNEGMTGSCETSSGNIKALVNTKNKTYPGLVFISNSIVKESDLLKILDTLKFN